MSVMDFIAPEEHERARANIVKMLSENYPGPNEYHAIRKDRSCFDIEVQQRLDSRPTGKSYSDGPDCKGYHRAQEGGTGT